MFGGATEMRRPGYAISFMKLLCSLAMGSSEGKRRIPETFFSNEGRARISPKINEKMVEEAWIHCKKEMAEKRVAIKDFDLYIPQATNDLISTLSAKQNIHKAIDILPQVRETIFACLRKKGPLFHASNPEVTFKHCFQRCLEFIFKLPTAPRRYLVSVSNKHITSGPSLALVPEIAPLIPASTSVLTSSPATFSYGPTPSHQAYSSYLRFHPPGGELANSFHVSNMISTTSPPPDLRHSHSSPSYATHKHLSPGAHDRTQHSEDEKQVVMKTVIAVIATAATTFALVTLVFFCCLKRSSQKKDEKPLLYLSDVSPDSSQKSSSLGSSSNKEFSTSSQKNPSFASSLSMKKDYNDASLAKAAASDETVGATFLPLKPPPGRSAPPPPTAAAPLPPPRPKPPPPPKVACPPPMLPKSKPSPLGPRHRRPSASGSADETVAESGAPKGKLKPFFWDKVMAKSDQTMVWHEISAGSFQFNEEMIETLFGYNQGTNNQNNQKRDSPSEPTIQYIQIIDTRKAQNLSILLRALNVTTEEVVNTLQEDLSLSLKEIPRELLYHTIKP